MEEGSRAKVSLVADEGVLLEMDPQARLGEFTHNNTITVQMEANL